MISEASTRADFSTIRYAQCWEDADVLLEALQIQPDDVCLSIASAGDNTLALLARNPRRVIALDLNPAQLACLQLRVAAYRALDHPSLLELIGSRPSPRRIQLYHTCRPALGKDARRFWDARTTQIEQGIGSAGKFERYFATFRERVLPWIHSPQKIRKLMAGGDPEEMEGFYSREWDTWRWKLLFRFFFSRFVMGRMGRDPSFFRYVRGDVSGRILARSRHALTRLNPAENPYLQWILTGTHGEALPFALRAENFELIRRNLDRLEWRLSSVEEYLKDPEEPIDGFNLSDIFEYVSEDHYHALLAGLVRLGRPGARLVYWNTLVDRHRPESMSGSLRSLRELSREMHALDKAFFYCHFVVEEVVGDSVPKGAS